VAEQPDQGFREQTFQKKKKPSQINDWAWVVYNLKVVFI
jgi:hypothetical protein